MDQLDAVRRERATQLRERRDALAGLLREALPTWRFTVPAGGQVLWCELPTASSGALAAVVNDRGLRITPGSRFAADGTLESWVRLPYTRPVEELTRAVAVLAQGWAALSGGPVGRREPSPEEAYVV